ncbi:cytochrome o ubiquinol oxidase subunit IV [Paenibacillus gyeongsangnamensis]|uniref:cytochrome o ubiquinol oxidase subunit IV n=1 Tax=Paenibacillus gyeongsangnamensis TaxID=3388067 RepID=UPI0039083CFF
MHQEKHDSTRSYIFGFILSIVLTIIPLVLGLNHILSTVPLIIAILTMAILQFLVQLFFFMHIRESERPGYNIMALVLGVIFVITIVASSVWIMSFNSQVQ